MKLNYIILFVLFLVLGTTAAYGQWDTQVSQYWRMKNFYNPSFIADNNVIEASLLHRRQWVGIENAPVTSLVSLNMPVQFLGKEHGVGVMVVNDKLGLFSNTSVMGQYSYRFKFKKNKYLNVGLQAGLIDVGFDASKIIIPDDQKNEIELPPAIGDKKLDVGLGVSWVTPKYYLGASATHILEPKFDMDDEHSTSIGRIYYVIGGYNIQTNNPLIELQPSALFKSDAVTYQLDVTARVEYKKMFNGGISWRKGDGFVFLLGVKIKNIDAGYSYDLSTSAISKVSNGSHELFIRYSMPLEKRKDRHTGKSIRIL